MGSARWLRLLLICSGVMIWPGVSSGQNAPTRLTSGVAVVRGLGPVATNTLFTGDYGFVITVPVNTAQLDISLSTLPMTADVDLYVRRGTAVEVVNQQVVADQDSSGPAGVEAIRIVSPVAGEYFIALGLFTSGVQVGCTVKATLTGGAGGNVPTLPTIGVLNAADNTANFAPGTILSLYGANLATGTLSGALPMPTSLLGTTVEVQVSGRTVLAPLFFVSAGQVNAQLPYEATGSGVQIRVKTAAGASDWVVMNVAARAPRILTVSMTGSGAPILQHHADYKVVTAENPAQAGEIVTLYLLGLGATTPAVATGAVAGDGSTARPLNAVAGVTVKVGSETAEVFFAGLTPYLVGLYQVDFRVPTGVVAGTLPVTVTVGATVSQTNVMASCGAKEVKLVDVNNTAGCATTATSAFALAQDAYVSRLGTWYRWNAGETSVGFTMRRSGQTVMQGTFVRGACDPTQTAWCVGETPVNQWWTAGSYELTVNQARVCANAGSANQGFVTLYGAWKSGGGAVVSSTIGAAGGSVTNGGLVVNVAAGAFNSATVLNLSQVSDGTAPAGGRISEIYKLEPLPGSVTASIVLTLTPVGAIPNVGKTLVFVKFDGEDDRGPMVLPGTVLNGKIVATLPAMPSGSVVPTVTRKVVDGREAVVDPARVASLIWAMGGVSEMASPSGKFLVHFPTGDIAVYDLAVKVGEAMDEARGKLALTGIEVDRRVTPIDVYLYSFSGVQGRVLMADANTNGESETELWGKQGIGLSLNLDQVLGSDAKWENARTTAAHEMFHVYQSLYDPRGAWRRSFSSSPWLWMMEAASTWFEKKMVGGSTYLSPNAKAYSDFAYLHGLEYAPGLTDKMTVSRHGYGASLLLDSLTAAGNDRLIGTLFADMQPSTGLLFKASLYSPVEALIRQDIFFSSKWTEFARKLALGQVNAGLSVNNLAAPPSGHLASYVNRADVDVTQGFHWDAPDLSMSGYKYTFVSRATKWATGSKLTFELRGGTGDATAHLFQSETGQGWVYQGTIAPKLDVGGADLLAKNGGLFFVLISNARAQRPFAGMTSIDLEIRVDVKVAEVPAVKADVLFEVFRVYKNPVGTSTQQCNDYSIVIKDSKGVVAETGASAARNGAYDTRLLVGDGYTYAIQYSYTTPCRDSGTASGRFDVKKDVINSVRVETPRCETN